MNSDEKIKLTAYNDGIKNLFGTKEKTENYIDSLDYDKERFYGARSIIRNISVDNDKKLYNLAVRYIYICLDYIANQNTINEYFNVLHTIMFNLSYNNYNEEENKLAKKAVDILKVKKAVESFKQAKNKIGGESGDLLNPEQKTKLQQYMTEIVGTKQINVSLVKGVTSAQSDLKQSNYIQLNYIIFGFILIIIIVFLIFKNR